MKDDQFNALNMKQREFWKFKFKDRVKFPSVNLNALMVIMCVELALIVVAFLFIQDGFMDVEVASVYVNLLQPLFFLFLAAYLVDVLYGFGRAFYYRSKERKWLSEVLPSE